MRVDLTELKNWCKGRACDESCPFFEEKTISTFTEEYCLFDGDAPCDMDLRKVNAAVRKWNKIK